MDKTRAFLIYTLLFELTIWGGAGVLAWHGVSLWVFAIAAVLCASNPHLKLSTWLKADTAP